MEWLKGKQKYRIAFLIIVPLIAGYFLYMVRDILLPFILAMLLAYLLNPLVMVLEKRGFPRLWSIILVYLSLGMAIGLVVGFGIPKIISELNMFADAIPQFTRELQNLLNNAQYKFSHFGLPESIKQVAEERLQSFEIEVLNTVRKTVSGIIGLFTYIISLIVAPLLAFYFLKDLENIKKSFEGMVPKKMRSDIMGLLRDIDEIISKFIRGHLLVSLIVGVMTGVGLAVIGMKFSLVLGIITGIAELVPYLGPIIGAVPILAIALLESKKLALYSLIVLLIVQQIETNIISPKILGDSLGLHPLMIIFVLLAGGRLWGIPGMLVAVPLAASIKVIINYIYLKLVG